jgi:hypothetical protein
MTPSRVFCAVRLMGDLVFASAASAQITGSPATAFGVPALQGQPHVQTYRRHNRSACGKYREILRSLKGGH